MAIFLKHSSFQIVSTANTNLLAGAIATDNPNIINGSYPTLKFM